MKSRFVISLAVLTFSVVLLTSCGKVPQTEIDAANAAITEAQNAGAETFVNADFIALKDSMATIMTAIEAEKSKFFKKFDESKKALESIVTLAQEVKQKSETRKAEVKTEVENMITEVKTLIEANNKLVSEAPKGKEGNSALLVIKDEITAIEASVAEVTALVEKDDIIAAQDKIKAAKEKATSINTELTEVINKFKGIRK